MHVVINAQSSSFLFVLNCPFEHVLHLRSVVDVPFVDIYWPATQFVKKLHVASTPVSAGLYVFDDEQEHITPTFLLLLFALLHVPVNGVSEHKLFEHVFHVGVPYCLYS